jgi:hypothetical protein
MPNLKGNVINPHTQLILVQPEQTDHALMAKEERDMNVSKPVPDGEVHEEPESGVADPLPYVWSM